MFRLRDEFVPSTTDGGGSGLGAQARPGDGEASATREKTRSIGYEPCQVPETTMFLTGQANPTPATKKRGQKRCTPENPRFSRVFFFFRRFSRFFKNQKTMRIKRCKTHFRGVGGDLNLRLPFFEVFWQLYFKISRNFF